ncbi:MAG TPA: TRAM domain-containing protein, partial [Candidatus Limnocylindrales bacterium]
LEILSTLQKDEGLPVEITDQDFPEIDEVDAKLVALAKVRDAAILTNDFNLNRVADLQGIRVLNVNHLANAVKPAFLPGEELRIRVIQEGKEAGQGVGFLDDGTMIVVEGGARFLDRDLDVTVTRVLQTVAGRMVFAHPRLD